MLYQSKQKNRPEFPCNVCGEWLNIDELLNTTVSNATTEDLSSVSGKIDELKDEVLENRAHAAQASAEQLANSDYLISLNERLISLNEQQFYRIMNALTDEAKEGPRLFSLVSFEPKGLTSKKLTSNHYRLTLYCEHSRLPLYVIDGNQNGDQQRSRGVYEIELTKAWFAKAAKHIKTVAQVLSVALPVVGSGIQLALNDNDYKMIEQELALTMSTTQNVLDVGKNAENELMSGNLPSYVDNDNPDPHRATGAALRELHVLLQAEDKSKKYGGLVRVNDNQGKFLWVHPRFEGEY